MESNAYLRHYEQKFDDFIEQAREKAEHLKYPETEEEFDDLIDFETKHGHSNLMQEHPSLKKKNNTNIPYYGIKPYNPSKAGFRAVDAFYIISGILEGAMAAIPTNIYNFQCSKNSTAFRQNLINMVTEFSQKDVTDGMKFLAKSLN